MPCNIGACHGATKRMAADEPRECRGILSCVRERLFELGPGVVCGIGCEHGKVFRHLHEHAGNASIGKTCEERCIGGRLDLAAWVEDEGSICVLGHEEHVAAVERRHRDICGGGKCLLCLGFRMIVARGIDMDAEG